MKRRKLRLITARQLQRPVKIARGDRRTVVKGADKFAAVAALERRRPPVKFRTEAALEQYCVDFAKELGWESRKMNGLGFNAWPDRIFIPPVLVAVNRSGIFPAPWVEFKQPGEVPTKLQALIHADLRNRGQVVKVFDNFPAFAEFILDHHRF